MEKRRLRIVKPAPDLLGVCERCNAQFHGATDAKVQAQFDVHKCKPVDSSQNAIRIVREAMEHK